MALEYPPTVVVRIKGRELQAASMARLGSTLLASSCSWHNHLPRPGSFVTTVVLVKSTPPETPRSSCRSSTARGHLKQRGGVLLLVNLSKDCPYHPSTVSSSIGGVARTAKKLAICRTPILHLHTSHLDSPVAYDFDS
jgi:hypothetical protein